MWCGIGAIVVYVVVLRIGCQEIYLCRCFRDLPGS